MNTHYHILGLMSGTSMDGLDLAYCTFSFEGKWQFVLLAGETIPYTESMRLQLSKAAGLSGEELMKFHADFGRFIGSASKDFIKKNNISPEYISSHGHTIFHQPVNGLTFQLGNGATIAAESGVSVISDFRTTDVAYGGQGAPLVPIGDRLLFGDYDYCLNLGGIANVSFEENGERIAFDVCACNLVLNWLAEKQGKLYDKDGEIAMAGIVQTDLLDKLNRLSYYSKKHPKSLGREDIERDILPILKKSGYSTEDLSATFCRHIGMQIGAVTSVSEKKMLLSGGGVFHPVLAAEIKKASKAKLNIPTYNIINFKEAIIFAFLGVLRLRGETNALSSVTGASKDNVGGSIFLA